MDTKTVRTCKYDNEDYGEYGLCCLWEPIDNKNPGMCGNCISYEEVQNNAICEN